MPVTAPVILFFTPTAFPNATERSIAANRFAGATVKFVPISSVLPTTKPEKCDGVFGMVPASYNGVADGDSAMIAYQQAVTADAAATAPVAPVTPAPAPVPSSAPAPTSVASPAPTPAPSTPTPGS